MYQERPIIGRPNQADSAYRQSSVLIRKGVGKHNGKVTMAREIRPLTADDIPELSQFLTTGFHTPPEADYAAPDVLRWKYLEPQELGNDEEARLRPNGPP